MGRRGEFYDQDDERPDAAAHGPPDHAGRGMLYDQDGTTPRNPAERSIEARRRRALDRQRERELNLQRELEFERARQERRQRAGDERKDPLPTIRISSRPGDLAGRPAGPWVPPVGVPPPPPKAPPRPAGGAGPAGPKVPEGPVRRPAQPGRATAPAGPPAAPAGPPAAPAGPPAAPAGPPAAPAARRGQPAAPSAAPAGPPAAPAARRPSAPGVGPPDLPPAAQRPVAPPRPFIPPAAPRPFAAPAPGSSAPAAAPVDRPTVAGAPNGVAATAARGAPGRAGTQPPGGRPPTGTGTTSTGKATAILAAGTFASRLTGFLRVLAIGYVLGVTSLSDAYNYANGVPNIIYDLLLGGILSATLIPVFVDQLRDEDRARSMRAISAVVSAITVALVAITGILWLLAPWVIHFYLLLNPASTGGAERALATQLLHYFAPQVFFLGAIVVSTALLNARRHFAAAAFSPVLNNLIAIAALLATKAVASSILTSKNTSPGAVLERISHDQHAIWVLGIGTTAGYIAQLLVQLPAMRRAGFRLRPVWDLHHPAVRRVARLSTWVIGVVIANQISLALVMILAGKVQGGVTAYQFSYQFFQLPYALIAVSVASALMPDLSERWSSGDRRGFERQSVIGLRVTLAVLTPVALAYAAIAQPFIQLAVEHGRVTASGAHLVSTSLAFFAVGLPGFSAFYLLMRMYQAMQNARIMFWLYALENGLTLVAALILDHLLGVAGLALAWVAPYTVASFVAGWDLRRRVGSMGGQHTVMALIRILAASAVTAGVVIAIGRLFPTHRGDTVLIARLIVQVAVGTAVYLGLAKVLGIKELRPVGRLARRLVGVSA